MATQGDEFPAEVGFAAIFAASPDGLLVVDGSGRIRLANPAVEHMFGYAAGELIGQAIEVLVPAHAAGHHVRDRMAYAAAPRTRPMGASTELAGRCRDGSLVPVDIMLAPVDATGTRGTLCVVRDARPRHATEAKLHLASAVFQTTQEAIVVTDTQCRILAVNPAFERVTEYAEAEVLGQHMRIVASGRHDRSFYDAMWTSIHTTGEWQGAIWNRRRSGEIYQEWLSISTVRDREGRAFQYVGVSADMTRMNHAETPIERLAHFDPLTGLPNRLLLDSRIRKTWERAHRDGLRFAVLFLDLDGFKAVNDDRGHAVGDELLRVIAARLAGSVRESDTVGRLGGDEFIVVLEDLRREDVARLADKLIARVAEPVELSDGSQAHVGLSLGWSTYPDDAQDIDTLMGQADTALYRAKRGGRGRAVAFVGSGPA